MREPFCLKTCCVIHFKEELQCHTTKCEPLNSQISQLPTQFLMRKFLPKKNETCVLLTICHPHLFIDCSDHDWSVPWFWSRMLNHKWLRRTVGKGLSKICFSSYLDLGVYIYSVSSVLFTLQYSLENRMRLIIVRKFITCNTYTSKYIKTFILSLYLGIA